MKMGMWFGMGLVLAGAGLFIAGANLLDYTATKDERLKWFQTSQKDGIVVVFQRKDESVRNASQRLGCQQGDVIDLEGKSHGYAPCIKD